MTAQDPQRILVVDGDDEARQLIGLALQRAGFEVVAAASGAAAVEQARRPGAPLDLVLLELQLPDMTSEAAVAALHALQPGLHFLVFTGDGDLDMLQRLLDTGYCTHLSKPRPLAELLEEIHWLVSLPPRTPPA